MKLNTALFKLFGMLICLSLGLSACSSKPSGDSLALEGTNWVLQSYADPSGQTREALSEAEVNIHFQDGAASGRDGCNQYSASYKLKGDHIALESGMATLMACAEPVMDQASAYQAALASAHSYKINANQLEIIDTTGKVVLTYLAKTKSN